MGSLPPCSFSSIFLRDVVTLWGHLCLLSLLIANEGFHWRGFLLGGSLPFRSGVVVSLRPLSVCHGSLWLVTALFPSFSWLLLLLRQVPWVRYLAFPMVVRTLAVGSGVSYASCLPFALHRALGILVPVPSLLS